MEAGMGTGFVPREGGLSRDGSSNRRWERYEGMGLVVKMGAVPGMGAWLRMGTSPGDGSGTQGWEH